MGTTHRTPAELRMEAEHGEKGPQDHRPQLDPSGPDDALFVSRVHIAVRGHDHGWSPPPPEDHPASS